ncbi:hypothetical protein F2Q68_00037127 [Brassica cretica]|uniref:Magnesium chelatase n=1 Tax=Brassica cretica TaxID=69181 RepID=A0A8S9H701_BRACR|nr:hypothetical protein F2Q68_00037127 [Brassica cretica]
MASLLGTSSIRASPSLSSSSSSSSSSSTPSISPICFRPGRICGRVLNAGIQIRPKKNRSRHHVSVMNVATEINSTEQQVGKFDSKKSARPVYPFAAIVGQDEMKLCLLLNVIDPKIGGVMIMGDRGTGKSTTVRSLVDLLPEITVVAGDPYNSDPLDPEFMGVEELTVNVQRGEDDDTGEKVRRRELRGKI